MKQKILAAVCALALCAALVPAGFAEQAAELRLQGKAK